MEDPRGLACSALSTLKAQEEWLVKLTGLVEEHGFHDVQNWSEHRSNDKLNILQVAAVMNFTEVVKVTVSEFGFDPNIPRISDSCTPLHLAIWYKCREMAGLLISFGADRKLKNSYGESCGEEYEKFVEFHVDTIKTLFCNDNPYNICIMPWSFATARQ